MKRILFLLALLAIFCAPAAAQTVVIGEVAIYVQTTAPTTCKVGDLWIKSDATSGQWIRAAESTGPCSWVLQGDGGGGGGSFDSTAVTNLTWSDGASASVVWSFNLTAGDPQITFGNGVVNITSGVLQVGGTSVVLASRAVNTSAPLTGGGALSGDLTIECRPANASQSGCLEAGDFSTFNSKIGGSGTLDKLPKFTSSGAIGDSAITEDADSVNFSKKIEVSEIVITGAGAGAWQFTTGTLGVGDTGTVKVGAHTGDVFSVSEGGGAVTPVIIGTRANFPNNAPTDDNVFVGNGSAWQVKALSSGPLSYNTGSNAFSTTVRSVSFEGVCQNTTASFSLDTPTSNAPAAVCITGSNVVNRGALAFDAATDETVYGHFLLPADWGGTLDLEVEAEANEAGTNAARLSIAGICVGAGETFDPAFNTAQTFAWTNTGAGQRVTATQSTLTVTGCAAGERYFFKFFRDADGTSGTDSLGVDLRVVALRFKY